MVKFTLNFLVLLSLFSVSLAFSFNRTEKFLRHFQNVEIGARIIGGQMATQNQFQYQVVMFFAFADGTETLCSGSILSQNFVLTAAHCPDGANFVEIWYGSLKMNEDPLDFDEININPQSVIIHSKYDRNTLANDIALIKLVKRLTFKVGIQPLPLPAKADAAQSFSGLAGTVAGFGQTSDKAGSFSNHLLFVQVPIITNDECKKVFGTNILATNLCSSGASGKNTCRGDSGSPLVATFKNKVIQVGIVSFGVKNGCEQKLPAVYTRITSYLDWIAQNSDVKLT